MHMLMGWRTAGSPANTLAVKPSGSWNDPAVASGVRDSCPAQGRAKSRAARAILMITLMYACAGDSSRIRADLSDPPAESEGRQDGRGQHPQSWAGRDGR